MKISNNIEVFSADCQKFDDLYMEIVVGGKYSVALSKEPEHRSVSIHLWDMQIGDWGEGVNLDDFKKALDSAEHCLMTRSEYQEEGIER